MSNQVHFCKKIWNFNGFRGIGDVPKTPHLGLTGVWMVISGVSPNSTRKNHYSVSIVEVLLRKSVQNTILYYLWHESNGSRGVGDVTIKPLLGLPGVWGRKDIRGGTDLHEKLFYYQ